MFIKLHSRFQFSRNKVYVSCLSCLCDSFKPHCQSTRLFFMTVSVLFFSRLPHVASAQPIHLLYSPKERIKKISVPILIACRSRLINIAALLLTPLPPPPKKMSTSRHLLCTAAMAASLSSPLKRISTDGKKNGRHLEGTSHVAPHSPALVFSLPVIIFVFV